MMNSVIYTKGLGLMFQGKVMMVKFAAVLVANVEQRMTMKMKMSRKKRRTKKRKRKKMKLNPWRKKRRGVLLSK